MVYKTINLQYSAVKALTIAYDAFLSASIRLLHFIETFAEHAMAERL